nr:tail fiber domain-containing protein [Candidatus Pelagibacter sp.]
GNVNVDGTLTAGTAKFGENVESSNDGIWLNANNYWYDTGTIKAQDGTIGGWTLGSSKIFKQTAVTDVQPNYAVSLDSTNQHLIFQSGSFGSVTDGHYTNSAIMTEINQDQAFTNETTTYTEGKDSFVNLNKTYSPTEELVSTSGNDTTPVYIFRGTGTDNNTVDSSTSVPAANQMWQGNEGTPHIPLDKLIYNKLTFTLEWQMEGTARSTIAYTVEILNGDGDTIGPPQSKGYFSNSSTTVTGVEEDFVFKLPSSGTTAEESFYYKLTPNIQKLAGVVVSSIDITNNYIKTWGTKTVISNMGLQVMEGPYQNVRIGSGEFRTEGSLNVVHAGGTGGHINVTNYLTVGSSGDLNKALNAEYNLYIGSGFITGSEGSIGTTKNIVAYVSDERLKDDVTPISNPINKIKQIGGYNFTWGTGSVKPGEKDVGVISQEVEKILPEVIRNFTHRGDDVRKGATAGTFKSVLYDRMVPLLVEGIKEQQDQIDYLKEQLNTIVCGSLESE